MKYLLLILFFVLHPLFADEIVVNAQELIADEKRKITQLKGNVQVIRGDDKLEGDEAYIYLDKNNRPEKMHAIGKVHFWLTLKDNRKIQGNSDEVIYLPNTQEYQIIGNAFVEEPAKNNKVKGDKIIIRYEDGYINVLGNDNSPARLIFKLEKEKQ